MVSLSIIIVNFHSAALITDCIRSVYACNKHLSPEIIVVDNSNDAAGKSNLLQLFPGLRWINMGYNAGFARANNRGMESATGPVFLLLNPDTLCIDDSIERCLAQLKRRPFVAAGVQLLDANRQKQMSGSLFVQGGLNHLLPIPYWGNLIRWLGYKTRGKAPGVSSARKLEEVDWISGSFMMVKREAVQQAGMMDEDFFLYGEEVEWCSRLRRTGKLCLFGELSIIHLEGTTINQSQEVTDRGYQNLYDRKGLQLMVSNHLRVRKQYGAGWYLFLLLNYTWGWLVFWIASTLHHLFTFRNPATDWHRVGGFGKNLVRLWALAPRMLANKPHFYKMF